MSDKIISKIKNYFGILVVILSVGIIIFLDKNPKVIQYVMQPDKTWDLILTILGGILSLIATLYAIKWSAGSIGKITLATTLAGEDIDHHVQGISFKPVTSSNYAPSQYKSKKDINKEVVKTSNANLYAVRVTSTFTSVSYFQLHDKNTLPTLNDEPVLSFMIPSASNENPYVLDIGINYFAPSQYFSKGISWTISREQDKYIDLKAQGFYAVNISFL